MEATSFLEATWISGLKGSSSVFGASTFASLSPSEPCAHPHIFSDPGPLQSPLLGRHPFLTHIHRVPFAMRGAVAGPRAYDADPRCCQSGHLLTRSQWGDSPLAQTILSRFTQVVSLSHTSLGFVTYRQSSRENFDKRNQINTPVWPQEHSRDVPAGLEGTGGRCSARAAGYSSRVFRNAKSPAMKFGLRRKSCWPTGWSTQLTCHLPTQKPPDAPS